MRVRVRFFGPLREGLGRAAEEVEVAEGTTARQLFERAGGARAGALAASMAYAVNMEYASGDRVLREGDEVAFLPPVSGG